MNFFRKLDIVWDTALSLLSRPGRGTLYVAHRLAERYGHTQSIRLGRPVDPTGNAWPWYTYSAIEYLEQLDFHDRSVFEYGCGSSTAFWARQARIVRSVEHNQEWYKRVVAEVPRNCCVALAPAEADYVGAIEAADAPWDIVVVDGVWRPQCLIRAMAKLAPGGMIVLDNSDWYPTSTAILRDRGFLQVDFSGYGPVNKYAWTTSVFFDRTFSAKPKGDRQPRICRGGLDINRE